jgi:formiminotetrahydrofolate cyclodeaminase
VGIINIGGMMQEKTIRRFTDELSSKAHIPGGGAVAALSGACAASLISMVINLTIGKEEFAAHEEKLKVSLAKAKEMRDELLDGMQRDADAFDSVMKCYKLPKSTKEEKKHRKEMLQEAFKAAACEPLGTMIMGRRLLDSIAELIPITNPNLVSDLGLAAINAAACSKGAHLNVLINLPYIKDDDFVRDAENWVEKTQADIGIVFTNTLDSVVKAMKKE